MEMWKDIPNYEGIYQASNTGHIRTVEGKITHSVRHGVRHWKSRVLKEKWEDRNRCSNGYKDARVQLYKNKTSRTMLVARLVAMAWVEGYKEGMTVNHIDGNPANNNASNLEWVSHAENVRKGYETGAYKKNQMQTNLIDPDGNCHVFDSRNEASRFLGRSSAYISNAIHRGQEVKGRDGIAYKVVSA